ncbi:MAG: heat-inducible transcriptional repressor HrcA [Clostridium sp.]|uniref:heat-inducible transcriptional repressor HrcA n=1 Tax=Clostridium sp. TaxID=1506 RepID=UPI003073EF38
MDERKIKILQAIINDYITYGEPVGSRTISKKYDLGISSATIRNEMADLEEMGFLEQLHSSSGRRPSDKGYRLYVDRLMSPTSLTEEEHESIKHDIKEISLSEVDSIVKGAIDVLSNITMLTSVLKVAPVKKSSIKYIKLLAIEKYIILSTIITDNGNIKNNTIRVTNPVDDNRLINVNNTLNKLLVGISIEQITLDFLVNLKSELYGYEEIFDSIIPVLHETLVAGNASEIYTKGATNIFNYPEYNNIDKAKAFLGLVNNQENLNEILSKGSKEPIYISIGEENFVECAKECSIITASYSCNGRIMGTIGVIGPTRIHYDKVVAVLNTVVKEIDKNISKIYDPY